MKDLLKSLLNQKDYDRLDQATILLENDLLSQAETKYISELMNYYSQSNETPSEEYFTKKYPEVKELIDKGTVLSDSDYRIHLNALYRDRVRQNASSALMDLSSIVAREGLTEEHLEELRKLTIVEDDEEIQENSYDFSSYKDKYLASKEKPSGLLTGVECIDNIIGGMPTGTVNVIAAFVASFKSVWGLNIAYNNTYNLGYNVAVLSLEVPKEDMMANILCRHSVDAKFSAFPFVCHDKIRKCILTEAEEDFIYNEVLEDLNNNSKGQLILFDETDFPNMSFTSVRKKLEAADKLCIERTGTGLDAVLVDHCHLLKFGDGNKGMSDGAVINAWVSFFRRLAINFKRKEDGTYQQLCMILLSQVNRSGWEKASKKNGAYSLTALSEANELERAAYRVFTSWTNENLKESKEATVQILKNRSGMTLYEPQTVYADGESYCFGEAAEDNTFSSMATGDDFASLFDSDMGLGGLGI